MHTTQVYSVQLTKSGKAIVHRTPLQPSTPDTTNGSPTSDNGSGRLMGNTSAAEATGPIRLTHDRRKDLPIPPDVPHAFLQRIGMQTAEGRLKADMADKMAQVRCLLWVVVCYVRVCITCTQAGGGLMLQTRWHRWGVASVYMCICTCVCVCLQAVPPSQCVHSARVLAQRGNNARVCVSVCACVCVCVHAGQ